MRTEEAAVADLTEEELAEERERAQAEGGADDGQPEERRTLADLAAEEPEPEEEAEQFTLFGTQAKINGTVRGLPRQKAAAVSIKSQAKELPEGQFDIDDVVELRVLARCDDVVFRSKRDKDGALLRTTRTHVMSMIQVDQLTNVPEEFAGSELDGRALEGMSLDELYERRDQLAELISAREADGETGQ